MASLDISPWEPPAWAGATAMPRDMTPFGFYASGSVTDRLRQAGMANQATNGPSVSSNVYDAYRATEELRRGIRLRDRSAGMFVAATDSLRPARLITLNHAPNPPRKLEAVPLSELISDLKSAGAERIKEFMK